MDGNNLYAIGQQDFKTLREIGALYVDKTSGDTRRIADWIIDFA